MQSYQPYQQNLKLNSVTQICPLFHSQTAHFPTRYLLYFPLRHIPYSLPLSEGQAGIGSQPSK